MKLLVLGNGGREHALALTLARSSLIDRLYWTPGNAATEELAENPHIAADDLEGLASFARKEGMDLTIVGPEVPLVSGIADLFMKEGLEKLIEENAISPPNGFIEKPIQLGEFIELVEQSLE